MSEWNQLNSSFDLIHLEFERAGLSETKHHNTIAETLGAIQEAVCDTDAKMQILGAGLGVSITETKEGPMSVWEAVKQLRVKSTIVKEASDGQSLYLDQLKTQLPNWGSTLGNLATSYQQNVPNIGTNLSALGARILSLETKGTAPFGNLNPFFNLGNQAAPQSPAVGVSVMDFDQAKFEIQEAFTKVKAAIEDMRQGSGGVTAEETFTPPTSGGL
jgi:hypothetical protein